MMILTIILGIAIGFVLFWLGYLTASMMFMAKHTDEIDVLDNRAKENKAINDNNKNKRKE